MFVNTLTTDSSEKLSFFFFLNIQIICGRIFVDGDGANKGADVESTEVSERQI